MPKRTFKRGDLVWWNDPDDGMCSGPFRVAHVRRGVLTLTDPRTGIDTVTEALPAECRKIRGSLTAAEDRYRDDRYPGGSLPLR